MSFAEVSVNTPAAQRRSFTYTVPPGLPVQAGQAVWVPFGDKQLQGIVLELSASSPVSETRAVAGIIEAEPLLTPAGVKLARWISEHYLSPLFDAVALFLPPGFERKTLTCFTAAPLPSGSNLPLLTPEQAEMLELVRGGRTGLAELEKRFGEREAAFDLSRLAALGLVVKSYQTESPRIKAKTVACVSLAITPAEARTAAAGLGVKAARQAALLNYLAGQTGPVPLSEANHQTGGTAATAKALAEKGLARITSVAVTREPIDYVNIAPNPPPPLTTAQQAAVSAISAALNNPPGDKPPVFLLHGVTGSGKTEVYLQAVAETVKLGKRAVVLVPEISLTPQTIARFAGRFARRVAGMHSGLAPGEQYDEWRRIRAGEFAVVVGPRGAIFAPQPDLGLIVIDEEHEWSYKQTDRAPRYHAREVAIKLAEFTGAVAVLGSATPDVVTFYHAQNGDYRRLRLPERVTGPDAALPAVQVVDMRAARKAGNRAVFSRPLGEAIAGTLARREEAVLFLNRRGGATFVQCRACGLVLRCKRCDTTLTYHSAEEALVCHRCNYRVRAPQTCPRCHSPRIKFLGLGTQKLEEATAAAFPGARLLRWDSDALRGTSHDAILDAFLRHQADILIGTQMIAKGLDLPLVTLVGVVSADTSLNLPDFRAGERTFQLLAQVAGRAGRGPAGGRVIIQTYTPEHYAVAAASGHDYAAFYEQEINFRRRLGNPPFARLAGLVFAHTSEARCREEAERRRDQLNAAIAELGLAGLEVIGPAPAFVRRLRGRYRWQLTLRGPDVAAFLSGITLGRGWTVDIDPLGPV